tara:strand:- start:56805 stop:57050 length:246 start_codon:yes stop_codon:yes gene_type:complete
VFGTDVAYLKVSNLKIQQTEETTMLGWALMFFIIAIVAAVFGFGGIAGAATGIAKIIFFIFIVLLVLSLISNALRGKSPKI